MKMTTEVMFATLIVIGIVLWAGVMLYDHFYKKVKH